MPSKKTAEAQAEADAGSGRKSRADVHGGRWLLF
jgi:hypothetical protein